MTLAAEKIILSESIHAYDWQGAPVPMVPRATPKKEGVCPSCNAFVNVSVKGDKSTCPDCKTKISVANFENIPLRKTTTRDMKKYGLFPSVSRLCSYGEMSIEFTNWYKSRMANHVMDCYHPDRGIWMVNVNRGLEALENEYSDRGTEIHGRIQCAMEGTPYQGTDPTVIRCIAEIKAWEISLKAQGSIREQSHCDPQQLGLGGCTDFATASPRIIADYKTKHSAASFEGIKKGRRSYLDSAIKQIAAYSSISSMSLDKAFVIVIRVDEKHPDTGETLFIELTTDELAWGLKAIRANTEAWFINQRYDPREMYFRGECKTSQEIMKP